MKTKLLLFLMILLSSGCKNSQQKNDGNIIVIDLFPEPESKTINVSDIATDLEYIPLQTTAKSLVRSADKVVVCDNKFYVKSFTEILCFGRSGNFLYKLSNTGRGPAEYTFIYDFDVSSDNKQLILLTSGKILLFNITGTEFIFNKSINLGQPTPSRISMVPGTTNILLSLDPITAPEQTLTILINSEKDTLFFKPNCYMYEQKNITSNVRMAYESLQYQYGSATCFKEEFSDTVFFVDRETNKFQPRLIFDSHGEGVTPRVRYDREIARANGGKTYWVSSIMETSRYIFYTYDYNRTRNKMIYDKSSENNFLIGQLRMGGKFINTMKDDLNGGPVFDPAFCSKNNLYSSVDALTLKKHVASEDFQSAKIKDPKKKNELKKLADSMAETDNPVLLVMKPKN